MHHFTKHFLCKIMIFYETDNSVIKSRPANGKLKHCYLTSQIDVINNYVSRFLGCNALSMTLWELNRENRKLNRFHNCSEGQCL